MKSVGETENTDTATESPLVMTSGEVFTNGCMIEAVASMPSSRPNLLFWNGKKTLIASRIEYRGRIYQSQELHASILQAMRLPLESASYGTIQQLFTELKNTFEKYLGFTPRLAELCVFWTLTTWFPDCLMNPPVLWAYGADIDVGAAFLALLHCLCRRGLRLTGVTRARFLSLPLSYRPTLLVHQPTLPPTLQSIWYESNHHGLFVPGNGGAVLDVTSSKAIFLGMSGFEPPRSAGNLLITLLPPERDVPLLDDRTLNAIAHHFLPRLLQYRLDHAKRVRESRFVASDLRFPTRELAHRLGACIQGDPDLALQVVPLLRPQDDMVNRCNLDCAFVEILWPRVHRTTDDTAAAQMKIGFELTPDVNTFLFSCGEIRKYSREEIGKRVSKLGLTTKDTSAGTLLLLDRNTSLRVHQLARSYGINKTMPECPECRPIQTSAE
jgi:hypothetical protein